METRLIGRRAAPPARARPLEIPLLPQRRADLHRRSLSGRSATDGAPLFVEQYAADPRPA